MMRGGGMGLGLLMSLPVVLLVIAVIALVVWLIVKLVRSSSSTPAQSQRRRPRRSRRSNSRIPFWRRCAGGWPRGPSRPRSSMS